jgi:hypothetical protein
MMMINAILKTNLRIAVEQIALKLTSVKLLRQRVSAENDALNSSSFNGL